MFDLGIAIPAQILEDLFEKKIKLEYLYYVDYFLFEDWVDEIMV